MMVGVISFIVGTLCLYRLGRWTVATVSSGVWAYTTVHPALLTVGSIVTYPYTIPVLHHIETSLEDSRYVHAI
jgi:hypothetical protein